MLGADADLLHDVDKNILAIFELSIIILEQQPPLGNWKKKKNIICLI